MCCACKALLTAAGFCHTVMLLLCPFSHECAGGEVHWGWRCSGAHRGQTGGYEQSHFTSADMLLMSRYLSSFMSLTACLYLKGVPSNTGSVQKMVTFKSPAGRRAREEAEHDGCDDEHGVLNEQNYVQALGTYNTEGQ